MKDMYVEALTVDNPPLIQSARLEDYSPEYWAATAGKGAAAEEVPAAPLDADSPRVGFAAASYAVSGSDPAARIVVQRHGSTDGELTFSWWTEGASAQPDVDYASLGRRIERIPSGTDKITVYVPIISNPQRSRLSQFYVALSEAGSAAMSAPAARATVTIDRGTGTGSPTTTVPSPVTPSLPGRVPPPRGLPTSQE